MRTVADLLQIGAFILAVIGVVIAAYTLIGNEDPR